jgi:serine/threonine-protein kinase
VVGIVGRGGVGIVYRARHVALNRVVALKMILAGGHASADQLARFRREAKAIARLQHPNVVQIYEVGEIDGLPFCALEFAADGNLAKKLAGTPLPSREAAELVQTLARAMHAAHRAGIIHRDLKPANVLLAGGTVKVTDFGLAKKLDESAGPTVSGAVMGTPSYMAPEQAQGRTKEIGPATDIYGLGAILYECLTGRPPFRAATVMETLWLVIGSNPVPPARLNQSVPRALQTICLKCLQRQPGQRYASAEALAEDLQRWLDGEAIQARPPSLWERIVPRSRWPVSAVGLPALVLLIVVETFVLQFFVSRSSVLSVLSHSEYADTLVRYRWLPILLVMILTLAGVGCGVGCRLWRFGWKRGGGFSLIIIIAYIAIPLVAFLLVLKLGAQ